MDKFQKRINYRGDLAKLLACVCDNYLIGKYKSNKLIESGYEDFNLKLVTDKNTYFVKIFAASRTDSNCQRLLDVVETVIESGVFHSALLKVNNKALYKDDGLRLAVFEYVEGETFFDLQRKPTYEELKLIIQEAAKINAIEYKPSFLYDSWAIVNFKKELEKAKKYLESSFFKKMEELEEEFKIIDVKKLPHSLVHGDLINTNIMIGNDKIYLVDFSVANFYPRIVELAVLMCNLLFDETNKISPKTYYNFLLEEYQKYIQLEDKELRYLPLFVKLAHAMHVVRGIREEKENGKDEETTYWIELGKKGLENTKKL